MDMSGDRHVSSATGPSQEALEFVRYCYGRRRVAWPELYDEMCAVAARGLYRGWGFSELAEHGIGFSLRDLPQLASLAGAVSRAEAEDGVCQAPATQSSRVIARLGEPLPAR